MKFIKQIIGLLNIIFSLTLFSLDNPIKYILFLCVLLNGVVLIKVAESEFETGRLILKTKVQNFQRLFGITTILVGVYSLYVFLNFYIGHPYWKGYFKSSGLIQISMILSFISGGIFTTKNVFDSKELKFVLQKSFQFIKTKLSK